MPFVALVGFLLYAENIELAVLIGAALIFVGNSYSLHRESRLTR
jgi:drug/metabolite transporter (DMT)-like permease